MTTEQVRLLILVLVTSSVAVGLVFVTSLASILIVYLLKTTFAFIVDVITFLAEVIVATVAAITSGCTITFSIIAAAAAASITFPASSIQGRIGVSVAVSSASIVASATAVIKLATLRMGSEVTAAVITAAAMSVGFAAAWAVGVMSLIEKETHPVGLRMTSILDTVRRNNYRILKVLLKLHVGIRQRDLDIALLHSVKAGYAECTKILLNAGARPDARDSYENTPLILACETGSYSTTKMLLEKGANVELHGGGRGTALHKAATWGYDDCTRLLLDHSADPNAQDGLWRTPLMLACIHAPHAHDVICRLIGTGCDVNTAGTELKTALHYAASRGLNPDLLLKAGADPNARDSVRNTPLHLAALEGHGTTIEVLIKVGCDPVASNYQQRTPLHLAAMKGSVPCVQALLEAGADLYSVDSSGNLPIWYAAYHCHYDATVFFIRSNFSLRCGRRISTVPNFSNPLVAALDKRRMDIAKALLIGGCDDAPLSDWLIGLPQSTWSNENAKNVEWLATFVQNAKPLDQLCRLAVREAIGRRPLASVSELPLPKKLHEFILMDDLLISE